MRQNVKYPVVLSRVPYEIYKKLHEDAQRNDRSVSGQIRHILKQVYSERR